MRLLLITLVASVVTAALSSYDNVATKEEMDILWLEFKIAHGKQYRGAYEEHYRKAKFIENYKRVTEHNARFNQGLETFQLKMNKYSDFSSEEFVKIFTGYKLMGVKTPVAKNIFSHNPKAKIPEELDWRKLGAVAEVKDQGQCGSCWAFSATGALEGQYFLKTGRLPSLSEQNLVDCSRSPNSGCNGGLMYAAFNYVHLNDGIDSEESYPYEGVQGDCRYNVANNVTSTKGFTYVKSGSEEDLKAAVATIGPISVGFNANDPNFQAYGSGVYDNPACGNKASDMNHAVLVIGYGTDENGKDYWLIKNSWGATWGEDGYGKIARNKNNQCAVATDAVFPVSY